ncbi:MAG: hypothetical protein KJP23_13425 [Deltaproteobacteria bacterium]|nr:hypothetical protein [Deltaproteobacteria bacterium]
MNYGCFSDYGIGICRAYHKGLGSLSSKEFNMLNRSLETDPILEGILPVERSEFVETDSGRIPDSLSTRETMRAGILAAVKEANL